MMLDISALKEKAEKLLRLDKKKKARLKRVLPSTIALAVIVAMVFAHFVVGIAAEADHSLAVFGILGYNSSRRARGPSVLVVQPSKHIVLLCVVGAGTDKLHKLVAEVGGRHTRSYVHMEATQSHFLENVDLTEKLLFIKLAVPSPEGSSSLFRGRVLE